MYEADERVTCDVDVHAPLGEVTKADKLGCWDLFGVDIMFDVDDNPYILELNSGPSMESPFTKAAEKVRIGAICVQVFNFLKC